MSRATAAEAHALAAARELGFEVDAIRELLDMSSQPDRSCEEADRVARHHLNEVDRRITRLTALREELTRMIGECGRTPG